MTKQNNEGRTTQVKREMLAVQMLYRPAERRDPHPEDGQVFKVNHQLWKL
jgi:hypothetical protein